MRKIKRALTFEALLPVAPFFPNPKNMTTYFIQFTASTGDNETFWVTFNHCVELAYKAFSSSLRS